MYKVIHLLFERDCRYDPILYHGVHRISYFLEYCFIPLLLFWAVSTIVKKEKSDSEYFGYRFFSEIMAKNWFELAITFGVTWGTLEFRLVLEFIDKYSPGNTFFTPYRLLISPFDFSSFFLFLHIIFTLWWKSSVKPEKEEFSNSRNEEILTNIKLSLLPHLFLFQLIITLIFYPFVYLRFFLSILFWMFFLIYHNKIWYTSSYWWNKAQKAKMYKNNISNQYTALSFLEKAYGLRRKAESNRKRDDLDEMVSILETIHERATERSKEKFSTAKAKVKRKILKGKRKGSDNLLNRIKCIQS